MRETILKGGVIIREWDDIPQPVIDGVILALWKQGLDTKDIAFHVECHESLIHNRLLHLRTARA